MDPAQNKKIVIVTGANRGIGYAIVEKLAQNYPNFKIILTARDVSKGEAARQALIEKNPSAKDNIVVHKLDMASPESQDEFFNEIKEKYQHIDILINNAGVSPFSSKDWNETYDFLVGINYHATVDLTEKLLPLLADDGKIISISSDDGELRNQPPQMQKFLDNPLTIEDINTKLKQIKQEYEAGNMENVALVHNTYATGKAFLTAYTRWILAKKMKEGQSCFSLNPGWCQTELSGFQGEKTAEQGTKTPLYLVGLESEKSKEWNGKYFNEEAELAPF